MRNKRNSIVRRLISSAVLLAASTTALAGLPGRIITDFQNAGNRKTPLGVTDGNPQAATAVFADSMYRQLGFGFIRPESFDVWADGSYGNFSSGKVHDGHFAEGDISLGWSFTDRVGLLATIPIGYRDTFGAKVYMGGFGLAVPIVVTEDQFHWTLSPWALIGAVDGSDLAQGGVQGGGGVTSLVGYDIPSTPLRLSMTNEACCLAGQPYGYGSAFNFKQNVSQLILKNGLELSGKICNSCQAYGSITYTNLTKDAFIDSYFTPELGLRLNAGHFGGSIAAFGDLGDRYTGYGARASVVFQW